MRNFITADMVRAAARDTKGGKPAIYVGKDTTITAEAKDLCGSLGVRIIFDVKRRPMVAANFKMNGGIGFLDRYLSELSSYLKQNSANFGDGLDVVVAPPFPLVALAAGTVSGMKGIDIGAQNAYFKESGAFTGEVSPWLLKECGAKYVIIGHSERRALFGETTGTVSKKLRAVVDAGLIPIFCLGENRDERKAGRTNAVIAEMLTSLYSLPMDLAKNVVIAYEPVWAIGTGDNATNEQIAEVVKFLRGSMMDNLGVDFALGIRILYGGSVNETNSFDIAKIDGVDGALVGGASLKAAAFGKIVCNFTVPKQ